MRPNLTIDEMAMRQLLSHKNDKSNKWMAKMNGRFGKGAANEAIHRNIQILKMCGITEVNSPLSPQIIVSPTLKKAFNNYPDGWFEMAKIQGHQAHTIILDDLHIKDE